MRSGKRVAAGAGLTAVAALAGALFISREEIAAWRRSLVVRQLLDPEKRHAAWREVAGWQRYPDGHRRYDVEIDSGQVVREVVVCPQLRGKPLLAVFFGDSE